MLFAAVVSLMLFASQAAAITTTINDGYWGATETDRATNGARDVVGTFSAFNIDKAVVSVTPSLLTIDIYTNFDPTRRNTGDWTTGTDLDIDHGDLFLSTDGWNPFGTGPYSSDDSSNGEDWELALVMDDHEGEVGDSGTAGLYAVGGILETDYPQHFREGQETQVDVQESKYIGAGRWQYLANDPYAILRYTIAWTTVAPLMDGYELGIHWTMTCGNDVIEGGAAVPEPGTMALLGMGLLGAVPLRRKNKAQ